VLHVPGPVAFGSVIYPVLPWIGVIALGYGFAPWYVATTGPRRRHQLLLIGALACLAFVALRWFDHYGDPHPWSARRLAGLSFLNVTKYPPSLDYALVTLGPMMFALAAFERSGNALLDALATIGRVPLFAYVVHLYIVHALAGLTALALGHGTVMLRDIFVAFPEGWGFGLLGVYLVWAIVLALLYPACRWFAGVKARSRSRWLAYL
jgi:hypothetical protein